MDERQSKMAPAGTKSEDGVRSQGSFDRTSIYLAYGFGAAFLAVLTWVGIRESPISSPPQFWLLRVVASVAAAGVAAVIPGFLSIRVGDGARFALQAGGALAVFIVIWQVNPPAVVAHAQGKKVVDKKELYPGSDNDDERGRSLEAREAPVKEWEAAVEKPETAVEERETAVKERETAVKEREAAIEEDVAAKETETSVKEREAAVGTRETRAKEDGVAGKPRVDMGPKAMEDLKPGLAPCLSDTVQAFSASSRSKSHDSTCGRNVPAGQLAGQNFEILVYADTGQVVKDRPTSPGSDAGSERVVRGPLMEMIECRCPVFERTHP